LRKALRWLLRLPREEDQMRPNTEGCTQCKRAKRNCPGYRTQGDLIFRDESTNVVRKFKAKEARKQAALKSSQLLSTPFEEEALSPELALEIVQQRDPHLSFLQLAPTVEELATGFFVTNYVLSTTGPSRGYLDPSKYVQSARWSPLKHESCRSGRLFSCYTCTPSIEERSLSIRQALQSTNAALRNPAEVKKDSTLLSIMILGFSKLLLGTLNAH